MSSTQLKTNILILIILGTVFTILAIIFGTSMFSPDSWSYYELSKTIFTNNFYEFNTYRSYFSDLKSAAFPFGYPIVLATINLISENPINAVFINILFTILAECDSKNFIKTRNIIQSFMFNITIFITICSFFE